MTPSLISTRRPVSRSDRAVRRHALVVAVILAAFLLGSFEPPGAAWAATPLPVNGTVIAEFDPPDQPWLAGHRGVDVAAPEGSPVRATAAGTVAWVGTIDSVTSISVELADGRRHTYQPVTPAVSVGQRVTAGQVIGHLTATLRDNGHCPTTCLHWGLKRGDTYFDPRMPSEVRLLPNDARPAPPPPPPAPGLTTLTGAGHPVPGPVTSPFGMRRHPITGVVKLHDGVDLGAPCGTPVTVPWPGTVTASYFNIAWGNRVVIDHGVVGGKHLTSTYNHLQSHSPLPIGQSVSAGQVVGQVGTTGYSTGCHLHWGTLVDGTPVDPLGL